MQTDRPVLGILLMLGFCVVAPLGDATAKLLGTRVGITELLLIRFAMQAAILIPLVAATGRTWRMQGLVLRLAWVRTCLHMAGIGAMFTALKFMPLADAVAIAFVMPFLMLLLGHWLLGEEVGPRRLLACGAGFVGTLLVIQPSFADVGWYALLPVGVAVTFSFFMLITRRIAHATDPIGLQAVNGLMATILILPFVVATHLDGHEIDLTALPPDSVWLLLAIGALGTGAHLLMTWALRFAPSATLAPMQYLEIPVATIAGFAIFGDLPNTMATVGILITVGAGLYVVMREQATQRARARLTEPEMEPAEKPAQ
ncbi:DMT family transporter [Marinibacterium profundimaris]|uniref:Membrane protein n=1 Tax=Marinibacterium profundimaris TaxID=1679460 RepID=A0A225NKV9_9RHOB|nr:DMT family transporter [Marinibacterium profundimaris]OWU72592.1 membrane protein [Marinibacterium profundimaris]